MWGIAFGRPWSQVRKWESEQVSENCMKTWLSKFKISNALDEGGVAPKYSVTSDAECEEVRQFEEAARSLDRRLKSAQPLRAAPAGLHASVMQAVLGASRIRERQPVPTVLRWLPAPALALLVVVGVWWTLSRPETEPQPLVTAAAALEQSHQLTQQAPAAVLTPLSKEMENLNRDLLNAVELLVASVP